MTSDGSDVSVVMTVRDGARYLGEALDSILEQRPSPGEVVVVDDGSRDGTGNVLRAYAHRVETIRQEPSGFASGVNRAVTAATRPLLAFLDADDVWTPGALAARVARMADPERPDAVVGRVQQFVSPDVPPEAATRYHFDPEPVRVRLLGAMVIERDAFLRVGLLDEGLVVGAAIDWISRAQSAGVRFAEIDDVVLRRRIHGANVGTTTSDRIAKQALRDVVRAHHQRRLGSAATPVEP